MDKNKIQPLEGQSLLDIAVQTAGDVAGVISLATINEISITDSLDLDKQLKRGEEIDRRRRQYYEQRHITPATELRISYKDSMRIFDSVFDSTFE